MKCLYKVELMMTFPESNKSYVKKEKKKKPL